MKILHVSDTHLGYSAYRKTTADAVNQREQDVYNSFQQFIDYAVTTKPDLILHSGDLFDSVRPTNRALTVALTQLLRISQAGIPFLIISGNHETPKLRETGSIFRIFEHLDHIHPIYKGGYETYTIQGITIHCIPQCQTGEKLKESLEQLPLHPQGHNILMLHAGIFGMKEFRMGDFNEQVIPKNYLPSSFDYIALGHYHKGVQVTDNAFYAGSTERFSFKEAGEPKGFWELSLNNGRTTRFVPLNTREMMTLDLDCTHQTPPDILHHIKKLMDQKNISGEIVRLTLQNIPLHIYNTLDFDALRELTLEATHCELIPEIQEEEQHIRGEGAIGTLIDEWTTFFPQAALEQDRDEIGKLAVHYLSTLSTGDE